MTARFFGCLAVMAALLATGLSTGAQVYYLLLLMLALLMALSLISVVWTLLTLRVDIQGIRDRVTRGDSLMTLFTVRHSSLLPVASVRVIVSVPSQAAPTQELSVATPPFRARTFRHAIRCPHRGSYETGVTELWAVDLFGLFHLKKHTNASLVRVSVMPRVNDAPVLELKVSDTGPEMLSRATEDAASPSDVRAWQEGDVLKKVHWKLTMRKRELMVRTFEESSRPDTLIIPDLTAISALPDQALTVEDCVCEACVSAARAQLESSYPVRMPLTSAQPSEISGQFPADFSLFHDALMRVKFDSPYAYEQVLALMMQRMQRTGGAVLVTPRLTSRVADAALRLQHGGVAVKVIWVTDTRRSESLEMVERLRMESVAVELANPWSEAGYAAE